MAIACTRGSFGEYVLDTCDPPMKSTYPLPASGSWGKQTCASQRTLARPDDVACGNGDSVFFSLSKGRKLEGAWNVSRS